MREMEQMEQMEERAGTVRWGPEITLAGLAVPAARAARAASATPAVWWVTMRISRIQ
jgi:hypothetical protein